MLDKVNGIIEKVRVWGIAGIMSYFKRLLMVFLQRHKLVRLVKASKVSAPVKGITVIADLTAQVSLSKTMRDFVLNLKDAGIPCQTYDTCIKPQIPAEDAAGVLTPPDEFDIGRYTHIAMMYRSPRPAGMLPQCRRVRIAFHDSEHGIHQTIPCLGESSDNIVAMSDFNYRYFKRAFLSQGVFKITYPFRFKLKESTPRSELRAKYGMSDDDFIVFFNFDFGSYYRKNIPAALQSFAKAFGGDASAKLLFKTKGAKSNPKQVKEMMDEVASLGIGNQFIHITHYLPRADIDGLTAACDVYLSLHKSEGFGIGMAEAMSQGKPVVATNWSANTEFCKPDTAWCVPYAMTPILPHEYPESMKEWADADVDAAAAALREIRSNPEQTRERALRGKAFMEEHFSIANFKADVETMLDR